MPINNNFHNNSYAQYAGINENSQQANTENFQENVDATLGGDGASAAFKQSRGGNNLKQAYAGYAQTDALKDQIANLKANQDLGNLSSGD